jgi:ABC-type sugar transport system substrate-binding protein
MKHLLALLTLPALVVFSGCDKKSDTASGGDKAGKKLTIALLPKSKGNQFFLTCEKGARKAANEMGVELLFDGPTNNDPAKQNEIVENWITLGVDAIAAASQNKDGISTPLKKAREKGITVVTYDSDANPDARAFFVNQATPQSIGHILMDTAAQLCGEEGEFAIITGTLTAGNLNAWRGFIEARLAEKYPKMKLLDTKPCDDDKDKAQQEAANLLSAYPNIKCIMAITSPAVPGAAEAVKQAGKAGAVKVLGLGLPSENRAYVKEGVTQAVILWNLDDLGYLTLKATAAVATGALKPGATEFDAGRLGKLKVEGDNILLGQPIVFTKENIDQFDF